MVEQVHPAKLAEWFARDAKAAPVLLDVREPWEVRRASVAAAADFALVAIPMNEIPARLAELDQNQPIACLCHHGVRSQHVAAFLHQRGFERIANIAGGIDAWSCQYDPSVPRY